MDGFDPEFRDLDHYIRDITERIWEGRGIDLIRRYYTEDCVMHTPMGDVAGVGAVIAGTIETLHAFPDRRLLAEDIVWSGDDRAGFLSSHRIVSVQTHAGGGMFGAPTGRRVVARTIADCAVRANRIHEEWLVRDQAAIAIACGHDVAQLGHDLAVADALSGRPAFGPAEAAQLLSGAPQTPLLWQRHPAAALVREGWDAIWNRADLAAIRRLYDPAVTIRGPAGRELIGHDAFDAWVIGYLASFPDARLAIDHSIVLDEPGRTPRVATRWRLAGTHAGNGAFGTPSGAKVLVLGITHSEVAGGRVLREWVLVDELAIHRQIARHHG